MPDSDRQSERLSGTESAGPGFTLSELAQTLEELGDAVEVVGDASVRVHRIRPLNTATVSDLSFLSNVRYRDQALASSAGALLVSRDTDVSGFTQPLLRSSDPYLAVARLLAQLHPEAEAAPGIHATAVVAEDALVDSSAHVGPFVTVGAGTQIEAGAVVHSHVAIGRNCWIGESVVLYPHGTLYDRTVVKRGTVVHAGAVLGSDGFGYAESGGMRVKLPQIGRVVLEEDVEVGANSTIDRATFEETRIGRNTKIDNLVQIGHNVVTGESCILCGQVGLSGSAVLGSGVVMGGQSGSAGHLKIGDRAQVAAKSAVFQAVPDGEVVAGIPAQSISGWRRQVAGLARLPDLRRRLRSLEKKGEGEKNE